MEIQFHRQIDLNLKNEFNHGTMEKETRYTLSDIIPISRYNRTMSMKPKTSSVTSSTTISTTPHEELPPADKFTIDVIKEEDADEVLRLLKKFFFKDEPLNTYLDLGECKELEEYSVKSISDGCSFKAVNPDGEIIGVFLSGIIERPVKPKELPADSEKASETCQHAKFKKILGLMDFIDERFNIFEAFPEVNKILDGKIMSVDTSYRGLGIGAHLTKRTMDYMREHKIPLMHVMCSSHFSARVMEKLDFKEVFQVPYTDYMDRNGEQVLNPAKPHVACRILVKKID